MSKSAHEKSDYKLRKLPRCSRCNSEFSLVTASYENLGSPIFEWECPKCHKVVPKELLREEKLSPDDAWLQEWLRKQHRRDGRRNNKTKK